MTSDPGTVPTVAGRPVVLADAQWVGREWDIPEELVERATEAKRQWPNLFLLNLRLPALYTHDAPSYPVVIRPLARAEVEVIQNLRERDLSFDRGAVLRRCVIYPEGFPLAETLAGFVETVYDRIEEMSGWRSQDELAELQTLMRNKVGVGADQAALSSAVDMNLGMAFPGMNMENLRNLDSHRIVEIMSMVEKCSEGKVDLSFIPKEQRAKEREKAFRLKQQFDGPTRPRQRQRPNA